MSAANHPRGGAVLRLVLPLPPTSADSAPAESPGGAKEGG
jgi:hypothetical protein